MSRSVPFSFLHRYALQPYWRLMRGLTLGVRGIVLDSLDRVLLVRHTYYPGWHFPGGGVERDETAYAALARELEEETGVKLLATPQLHGIFTNFDQFRSDHVVVFISDNWKQEPPPSSREIAERKFFSLHDLPEAITPGTQRRLREIFEGARKRETW